MVSLRQLGTPSEAVAEGIVAARDMLAEGDLLEDVWRVLRCRGFDMFDSKWVTMAVTGISSFQARRALYESDAWADMRPIIDQFERDMIEAALSMGAKVWLGGKVITDMSQV